MKSKIVPASSNLLLITDLAMNNSISHGEFRKLVQALPIAKNNSNKVTALEFVINEFATSPNLIPCEFRRLVQVAILQKYSSNGITKKLQDKTEIKGGAISQILCDLEKKGLLKRIKRGSYKVNTNKNDWFPSEMSENEIALKKDLEILEQMKKEILEKVELVKIEKQKKLSRKVG